jgi:predicted MFS family arabinose efflux permease
VQIDALRALKLDWHSIFLVNIPIGIAVFVLCLALIPRGAGQGSGRVDVAGALAITGALMLAVYGVINDSVVSLVGAAVLLAAFLAIESRVKSPLVPLGLFRSRNLATANVIGVLWSAGMFAWFFLSALYLQVVLGYDPLEVGLAFLPANLIMGAFSLGLSAKIVMRFGIRAPLAVGLGLAALGLLLFAFAPVGGTFVAHVLPGMVLLGIGGGMAFNPVLLAAMSDVEPKDAGLASGVVNTSFMMGGALGLAILASLAASRSEGLAATGLDAIAATNGGYQVAFVAGAVIAAVAAVLAATLLRPGKANAGQGQAMAVHA